VGGGWGGGGGGGGVCGENSPKNTLTYLPCHGDSHRARKIITKAGCKIGMWLAALYNELYRSQQG
jgi:hypothetical protein